MKRITLILFSMVLLFPLVFNQCVQTDLPVQQNSNLFNIDTLSFSNSMKGWELYSWKVQNNMVYSILPGTNRMKTTEEIIQNTIRVSSQDSLYLLLDRFAPEEYLFWTGNYSPAETVPEVRFCLPNSSVIDDIRKYCLSKHINLYLSE